MIQLILLILFLVTALLLLIVWTKYKQLQRYIKAKEILHNENHQQECQQECDDKEISLLRYYRHDCLNHLQVILGYAYLKKIDKIISYISQVREEARQHTLISKLNHHDLAVFLYMLPIDYPKIHVQLELSEDLPTIDFQKDGSIILQTLQSIFCHLQRHTLDEYYIHSLILAMNRLENQIVVNIEYEGNFAPYYEEVTKIGEQVKQQGGEYFIDLFNEQECIMEFHFPIQVRGVANVC
ncbi:Spo0B domain-containing protein [Tepidibacillus sp. LV47]|uniref:Spo0B domain-containing protein n=1 Tax=Tepidibacillus sp. LV47 TaxID=3398228 RepID=UPI003AAFBA61